MCDKCNKRSCSGCGSNSSSSSSTSSAQTDAILSELQSQVDTITSAIKVFICGHPILFISKAEDVAMFDSNGLGSNCWDGWAVCNGKSWTNPETKKPFVTDNFTDRFIVQAGGTYALGDTGGENFVTLDTTQIPAHNHGVTDPGHTHNITDPGHIHPIQDDMHTHQAINDPHHHYATLSMGAHTHNYDDHQKNNIYIGGATSTAIGLVMTESTSNFPGAIQVGDDNDHADVRTTDTGSGGTANGYTDNATQQTTISPSATGIEVLNALTGIDLTDTSVTGVTTNNEGGGLSHENRPPYWAAFYVIKMW